MKAEMRNSGIKIKYLTNRLPTRYFHVFLLILIACSVILSSGGPTLAVVNKGSAAPAIPPDFSGYPPGGDSSGQELIFIDAAVMDPDVLLRGIGPGAEIVRIPASADGLAIIAESLKKYPQPAAIHVISHGDDGLLRLGSEPLGLENIATRKTVLAAIGKRLGAKGELLLYGCSIAKTQTGKAFVTRLSAATGVTVAASDDATGNSGLGGDWDLEFATIPVKHSLPIAPEHLQAFVGLLYIDHATAPVFSVNPTDLGPTASVTGTATLPGADTALLIQTFDGSGNPASAFVRVVDSTGARRFTTEITSAMGSRATNQMRAAIHALTNGNIFVTWEGTNSGCDNNSNSLFQFVILNSSGAIITSATDISQDTAAYNCYSEAAELSNGNIAFLYQRAGDQYQLRIFNPYGTAVTSAMTIAKPAGCTSTFSHSIAANRNGKFMVLSDCYNNPNYFSAIYNNDGSVAISPFSISAVSKSDFPQSMATALSDNTFAVLYKGEPGADYSTRDERFRIIQPAGTLGGETIRRLVGDATIGSIHGLVDGGFLVKYDNASFPYATLYNNSGAVLETDRPLDANANGGLGADPVAPAKEKGFFYINDLTWQEHLYNIGSTSPAPAAATDPASVIGATGATLNGTVNANDETATVRFEYGLTTGFGTTLTADQSPVSGSTDTGVSKTISGLAPNTTYHYRAVAINIAGTTYGDNQTFKTVAIPATVTTAAATGVSTTGATLHGTVNANNADTTVTFEYGPDTSYGTTVSADQGTVTGLVDTPATATLSGLVPNTTYHYRVKGVNIAGTANGGDLTFTTPAAPPAVTTVAATAINSTGATLNGTVNANNASTTVTFEYGPDTSYGSTVTADQSPVTGTADTDVAKTIAGLVPNTTYHYRAVGVNAAGTIYGNDLTFTTDAAPPVATTTAATGIGSSGATLNGTVNANNASTAVTFEYGLTASYGTTETAEQSPVTGIADTGVSKPIAGLAPNTTYHYRAVGSNIAGTTNGSDLTFTTDPVPATVTTAAATGISSTGATLHGTVNANNADTAVTFEYGLDTSYGSTVTADQSPVTGTAASGVSKAITGLVPNTLYHYRVVGVNAAGTANGSDLTFTTDAAPPVAITLAATGIGSAGATLNGTVNANNASTTVTFEYGPDTSYGTTVTAEQSPVTGIVATGVSKAIVDLAPNTTYHYRVVGQNVAGMTYGSDQTFTTDPVPATVTTTAATGIGSTGATLNGTVNANNASTAVTFEYGPDTSYGSTVTADQSPVTGTTASGVSKAIAGLVPNTLYHYRAVGVNAAGTTYGSDLTFTTDAAPPVATTSAATGIGSAGATLNGTINANNASTTVTFEYGPDTSYGTTVTADQSPVTGIAATGVSKAIADLAPNTTYHYRVVGQNFAGTTNGSDQTFTTDPVPATVTTMAATGIGSTGATLNGIVNANNASTTVTFEYGPDTSYGSTVTADQSPVTGTAASGVSKAITGLVPNTLYHYRVVGVNAAGTANGNDLTFTTDAAPPVVTTLAATGIGSSGATLNGTVNANNASTTVTFEYGPDTSYGTTVTADQSPVTGIADTIVSKAISGLAPNTTYHYRVVGQNVAGTTYGGDQTFTTDPVVATVTTAAATGIDSSGATLNGTVNANNASTTVTFEYGPDTSYGTTVTADQNPVTGTVDTAVTGTISGLAPNTLYHYRVVGVNAAGTANGNDLTFTTDAIPPTVTTTAATGIGSSGATLNGTVNANNAETAVTFEYGPDTSYGSTVSADQSPVTGTVDSAVAVTILLLAPNTTYHYRVVGVNIAGTTYGSDLTFTTDPVVATVTSAAATGISSTGAALNGTVNANNASTAVTFEYGPDTSYGTTVTADQSPVTGSAATAVTNTISGLAPNTTYHYRVVGVNAAGTANGNDLTFTTEPVLATVATTAATGIGPTAATLNGSINANNADTAVTFEYGLTASYGTIVTADQSPVTGSADTAVTGTISGLAPNTTYHYRVVGINIAGTTSGSDLTFTTDPVLATVTTTTATGISSTGATLHGMVNANNADTAVSFEYGPDTNYGTTVTADQNPVTGSSDIAVAVTLTGLAANTTYHYRVIGANPAGMTYGNDQTFTSLAVWPLTVAKIGKGDGTVTSSPAGIDCGNDSTEEYDHNTVITLTATPDHFSRFIGWSGDADCEDGIVTMAGEVNCTANFYRFAWWLFYDVITGNPSQP